MVAVRLDSIMPKKPEKYVLLTCAKTSYLWNMQPYLGKSAGAAPERNQGMRVVLDLVEGLKGHNITTDNYITSYDLCQELLRKNLTLVGTFCKNKRSIPSKLLIEKKHPLYICIYPKHCFIFICQQEKQM